MVTKKEMWHEVVVLALVVKTNTFSEEELFLDEEDFEDYEGIAYGLHGPDIILL